MIFFGYGSKSISNKIKNKEVGLHQIKKLPHWGAWVAQLVKRPALSFGLGHDLRVLGSAPCSVGSLLEDSLSPSTPSHTRGHALSFSKINI